jgi:hypothetical protein
MSKSKKLMKGGGFFSWFKGLFTRKKDYRTSVKNASFFYANGGTRKKRHNNKNRKLKKK